MFNDHSTKSHTSTQVNATAKQISPSARQQIGVSAIAGKESIPGLSRHHETSRKFVYAQKDKGSEAVFHIPVTKEWLQQVVLSLVMTCHSF
ncbi:MAG: hypothetical protein ACI9S8_002569 [Chlamydiales bacterium]|jgi:hypothetical protein